MNAFLLFPWIAPKKTKVMMIYKKKLQNEWKWEKQDWANFEINSLKSLTLWLHHLTNRRPTPTYQENLIRLRTAPLLRRATWVCDEVKGVSGEGELGGVEEPCKSATSCTCLRSRDSLGPQHGAWPSGCGREEGKEEKLRDGKAEYKPTEDLSHSLHQTYK